VDAHRAADVHLERAGAHVPKHTRAAQEIDTLARRAATAASSPSCSRSRSRAGMSRVRCTPRSPTTRLVSL
jgi:hypothetical protein